MSNKKITMKQYNGTGYDELYPKTIASQVEGAYIGPRWTKLCTIPAGTYGTTATTILSERIDGSKATCLKIKFNNFLLNNGLLYIGVGSNIASSSAYALYATSSQYETEGKTKSFYLLRGTQATGPRAMFYSSNWSTNNTNIGNASINTYETEDTKVSVLASESVTTTGTIDIYYTEDDLF